MCSTISWWGFLSCSTLVRVLIGGKSLLAGRRVLIKGSPPGPQDFEPALPWALRHFHTLWAIPWLQNQNGWEVSSPSVRWEKEDGEEGSVRTSSMTPPSTTGRCLRGLDACGSWGSGTGPQRTICVCRPLRSLHVLQGTRPPAWSLLLWGGNRGRADVVMGPALIPVRPGVPSFGQAWVTGPPEVWARTR